MVLVKRKGHLPAKFPKNKFKGPYRVITKNNHYSYTLQDIQNGKIVDRNYNQLKIFNQNTLTLSKDHRSQVTHETSIHSGSDGRHQKTTSKRDSSNRSRAIQMTATPTEQQQNSLSSSNRRQITITGAQQPETEISTSRRYPTRNRDPPRRFL